LHLNGGVSLEEKSKIANYLKKISELVADIPFASLNVIPFKL
jgi:hypothetical protein